jgi:DNA polymerase-3 subunit epsilon
MNQGITLGVADTVLTTRASDFLSSGPADARTLIAHVCQLPAMPPQIAEHMAITLFAGHRKFRRDDGGFWHVLGDADVGRLGRGEPDDSLDTMPFIVVDLETTGGLFTSGHRITEIAAVLVQRGETRTVFESLVNPERPIPPYISRLTNIHWGMVKDAPTFRDICSQLLGELEGRVFVAHNASHDWRFLSSEVQRATGRPLEGQRLCTVKLSKKLLPQLRRRSLDYVSAHFAVENSARHRAGGDARATAQVLVRLLRDVQRRGCATWTELEHLMGIRTGRRKRRGRRPPAMPQPVTRDTTA